MHSVYGDPAYAGIQKMLHERLTELREKYGDSDENDQRYLKEYMENVDPRYRR